MEKTHTHIKSLIYRKKPGDLLFPTDFRGLGSDSAIKEDPRLLKHDLKLAPVKINNYILNIMKDISV
jgi:hypothetical protein